jgi:hypothetical protein
MQHNLAIDNAIHEQNVPAHSLVGWCHAHKRPEVRACHRDASRDHVAFGDLLLDRVPKVGKGRAHERVTLENLLKSWMLSKALEVVPVERVEKATNHSFAFVS